MLFCIIWITSYQFCWKKLTELLPTTTLHRILYIPLTRMFLLNSSCGIQTRICVVSSNFKKLGSEITERSLLHEVCSSNTPWQSQSWKTLASSLTAARRNQTRLSFVNQTSTFALIMILLRVFDPWRGKWRLRNRPTFQCKWWVLNTKHRLISKWWSRQWYEGQSAIAIVLKRGEFEGGWNSLMLDYSEHFMCLSLHLHRLLVFRTLALDMFPGFKMWAWVVILFQASVMALSQKPPLQIKPPQMCTRLSLPEIC